MCDCTDYEDSDGSTSTEIITYRTCKVKGGCGRTWVKDRKPKETRPTPPKPDSGKTERTTR